MLYFVKIKHWPTVAFLLHMYLFINLKYNSGFFCDEDVWIDALVIGKRNGWLPAGTMFDFNYVLDEYYDDSDDILQKLFTVISVNNSFIEWNGDYIIKESQIVSETDAVLLHNALKLSHYSSNRKLLSFLLMGSFRICDT